MASLLESISLFQAGGMFFFFLSAKNVRSEAESSSLAGDCCLANRMA